MTGRGIATAIAAINPNSLGGKAWTWPSANADGDGNALQSVAFNFTGSKTANIGVAFDKFETGVPAVPLPASALMLLTAVGGFSLTSRLRRSTRT